MPPARVAAFKGPPVYLERFAGGCSGECGALAAVPGGPAVPSGVAQGPAQAPQALTAKNLPLCHELFRGTAGARYAQPQSALVLRTPGARIAALWALAWVGGGKRCPCSGRADAPSPSDPPTERSASAPRWARGHAPPPPPAGRGEGPRGVRCCECGTSTGESESEAGPDREVREIRRQAISLNKVAPFLGEGAGGSPTPGRLHIRRQPPRLPRR
jgi:hypothetical protein